MLRRIGLAIARVFLQMACFVLKLAAGLAAGVALLVVVGGAVGLYESLPQSRIERRTGFRPAVQPVLVAAVEDKRVSHGREWDMLHVYDFPQEDGAFVAALSAAKDWQPLPLPEWVRQAGALQGIYAPHVQGMLAAEEGWWHTDTWEQNIYVYDAQSRRLYLRATSIHIWREECIP